MEKEYVRTAMHPFSPQPAGTKSTWNTGRQFSTAPPHTISEIAGCIMNLEERLLSSRRHSCYNMNEKSQCKTLCVTHFGRLTRAGVIFYLCWDQIIQSRQRRGQKNKQITECTSCVSEYCEKNAPDYIFFFSFL